MGSGLTVLGLVLLALIAVYWLLQTVAGRDVLLAQVVARLPVGATFTYGKVEGPVAGPLTLRDVDFRYQDIHFTAERVYLEPDLRPLLGRKLQLDAVQVSNATLNLGKSEEPFTLPSWPESLPQINVPLAIQADKIAVDNLRITQLQQPMIVLHKVQGGLEVATGELRTRNLVIDTDMGDFRLHGDYIPNDDYRADLTATAVLPAARGRTPASLGLVARGDLDKMEVAIAGRAPAPLQASLVFTGRDAPTWAFKAVTDALDTSLLMPASNGQYAAPATPIALNLQASGKGGAADLRDVGRRVLAQLDPAAAGAGLTDLPDQPCILLASDLSPSDTANLDTERVLGLATAQGGPTSHTAILSRTLGLPALVAAGGQLLDIEDGVTAIIDGSSGRLYINPSELDLDAARTHIAEQQAIREREAAQRALPAETTDGHHIDIGANVNLPDQVAMALAQGAEGVGLMRTEFLFLESGRTPSEDEQHATYLAMAQALEGRPLIVRALDIGGDKQVAHLELPHEENPFLGVRGARLLLRRPDLLEPQLRALYRAAKDGARLSIMFPMITSVPELIALREICARIRAELDAAEVPIGIMIEVPAAAAQADVLARHADFFSIGTNDLTQYVLAIDRQNPELAAEADSLHPAVLRMIRSTIEGARKHGRWVGVCGGLAGDAFGASLLAGLGVQELSMTPNDIPAVKARLRGTALSTLQQLAEQALDCETAEQVRALEVKREDQA
ncbi:phosphoenolpyruvate-protein phosphotransferase [Xanthomonas hortorum ATCC 19865]|nr:phosphoenolpyruvate-protein phosphotransferase [Xanthomonas hortorum ATCC 19865]